MRRLTVHRGIHLRDLESGQVLCTGDTVQPWADVRLGGADYTSGPDQCMWCAHWLGGEEAAQVDDVAWSVPVLRGVCWPLLFAGARPVPVEPPGDRTSRTRVGVLGGHHVVWRQVLADGERWIRLEVRQPRWTACGLRVTAGIDRPHIPLRCEACTSWAVSQHAIPAGPIPPAGGDWVQVQSGDDAIRLAGQAAPDGARLAVAHADPRQVRVLPVDRLTGRAGEWVEVGSDRAHGVTVRSVLADASEQWDHVIPRMAGALVGGRILPLHLVGSLDVGLWSTLKPTAGIVPSPVTVLESRRRGGTAHLFAIGISVPAQPQDWLPDGQSWTADHEPPGVLCRSQGRPGRGRCQECAAALAPDRTWQLGDVVVSGLDPLLAAEVLWATTPAASQAGSAGRASHPCPTVKAVGSMMANRARGG